MKESFEMSVTLKIKPEQFYKAWLDTTEHSNFTGSPAEIDPSPGGKFTAWDGYISGTNLELQPYFKIVQSWRTSEFDQKEEDSILEISLEENGSNTKLILKHSKIPEGQGEDYIKGWKDFYFKPMKKYFTGK